MSTVSPQGYQILTNPVNNNPFWEVEIEGDHIKTLYCTKTTEGDFDYYAWTYKDQDDVIHPIITQQVSNKAGEDGAIFTPSVSAEGVISWTNNGGLPNPSPISIRGIQGPQGPQGIQGPAGATGPQGETGPQGPRGIQGPQGEVGPTGPQGLTGPQGPAGADGTVEFEDLTPAQIEMLRGPQGVQGPAGPAGPQGPTGAQGPQGETGATGPQGPAGLGTVTVGTTTTGAEGTQASVTNSGTTQDAILNFTIPKGDTGATGPQGPQGPAGQDGAGTTTVGTTTTGQPGTQASVVNSGTPQNAVLDFTIPQGAQGPAGQDGADGADGAAATIAVGTVTTGQPGTQATVTNSGTSSAAVFDFTIPQGAAGQNGTNGQGVPTGGTAGQVLAKIDGTDYNTEWVTPSGGGGGVPLWKSSDKATIPTGGSASTYLVSTTESHANTDITKIVGVRLNGTLKVSVYDNSYANVGNGYVHFNDVFVPLTRSSNTSDCVGFLTIGVDCANSASGDFSGTMGLRVSIDTSYRLILEIKNMDAFTLLKVSSGTVTRGYPQKIEVYGYDPVVGYYITV